MAGSDLTFKIDCDLEVFNKISDEVDDVLREVVADITNDLLATAQARAPKDGGDLEQSGSMTVNPTKKEGNVSFYAARRGYNYARKMDQDTYNLGEMSKRKSAAKSKFYTGSLPVGTGFLSDTADKFNKNAKSGYVKYIDEQIKKVIDKYA